MPPTIVLNSLEQPGDVPCKVLFPRNPRERTHGGDELTKQKALYHSVGGEQYPCFRALVLSSGEVWPMDPPKELGGTVRILCLSSLPGKGLLQVWGPFPSRLVV